MSEGIIQRRLVRPWIRLRLLGRGFLFTTAARCREFRFTRRLARRLVEGTILVAWTIVSARVAWSSTALKFVQVVGTDRIQFTADRAGKHKLELDDADGFVTPVVTRNFAGKTLELSANEVGLIPGIAYHLRLDGERNATDLRLAQLVTLGPKANCERLRNTWEVSSRFTIGRAFSGLLWEGDHWKIIPHIFLLGESLYNVEMVMRPAMLAARFCGDGKVLDQIAQYYVIMLQQTETVGDILHRPNVTQETSDRLRFTDPTARTFSASFGKEAGEGELYNAQWLHPAALLLRWVSQMPTAQRTPAMKRFASLYSRFVVKDQLERYFFAEQMPSLEGTRQKGRVAHWEAAMRGLKGREPWNTAMSDIDLWLLASTAEMLGAHANDPLLVPMDESTVAHLQLAMKSGIRFFKTKRTGYPDTRNFTGKVVGSASYFNGDYATHPDLAFSAVGGEKLPTFADRKENLQASWDSSHAYRLPIFLRALYENRKALDGDFPRFADLEQVVNQYIYQVFTGDYSRPRFKNYFDGSDGWMRVGYNGDDFGHPPSDSCDMRNPKRPCLMPGMIIGWGELSFVNADLARLEQALVELAFVRDPVVSEFRDRHYFYGSPYQINLIDRVEIYGGALYYVVAENADRIPQASVLSPQKLAAN